MPLVHFDCPSGISGDMVLGALVDAGVPLERLNQKIATLRISGLEFERSEVRRMGLRATKIDVRHTPEHKHRHLRDIETIIVESGLDEGEQELARRFFRCLAEAEAKVHGCDIQKVHFHEVGAVDSIADIVGVSVGLCYLGIEQATFSSLPVGRGFVEIAHGRVGLPAPATAELLRGVPLLESSIEAELTTPTGAAIVRVLASGFGGLPSMSISEIGCGAGSNDFKSQPNILRLFIGSPSDQTVRDTIVVLETNVDDISGEIVGECCEQLRAAGALDVYTTSIAMKKNRPGVKLSALARESDVDRLSGLIFAHTRSLGIRRWHAHRDVLPRTELSVETRFGQIAGQLAREPSGRQVFTPEFDSCQSAAHRDGVPVIDVFDAAKAAFLSSRPDEA